MMNYKTHLGEILQETFLRMVEIAERKNDRREIHLEQSNLVLKDPCGDYTYTPTRWYEPDNGDGYECDMD